MEKKVCCYACTIQVDVCGCNIRCDELIFVSDLMLLCFPPPSRPRLVKQIIEFANLFIVPLDTRVLADMMGTVKGNVNSVSEK